MVQGNRDSFLGIQEKALKTISGCVHTSVHGHARVFQARVHAHARADQGLLREPLSTGTEDAHRCAGTATVEGEGCLFKFPEEAPWEEETEREAVIKQPVGEGPGKQERVR